VAPLPFSRSIAGGGAREDSDMPCSKADAKETSPTASSTIEAVSVMECATGFKY